MKFRTFATALLAGVFLASPVLAADQHFLADRHVAKGVKCESCHNPGAPSSKNVTPQNCLKCHGGSYEKLAEQTAGGDINYHNTHLALSPAPSVIRDISPRSSSAISAMSFP